MSARDTVIFTKNIKWAIKGLPCNEIQDNHTMPDGYYHFPTNKPKSPPKEVVILVENPLNDQILLSTGFLVSDQIDFSVGDVLQRLHVALCKVMNGSDNYMLYVHSNNLLSDPMFVVKIDDKILEPSKGQIRNRNNEVLKNVSNCFIIDNETVINGFDFINIKVMYNKLPQVKPKEVTPKDSYVDFYDLKLFTDFTIKCSDNIELNVHRIILAKASPYFLKLFTVEMQEKEKNFVEFCEIESMTMQQVIDFIYEKEFNAETFNEVMDLIFASEKFQMESLKDSCAEKLLESRLINLENVLEVFFIAELCKVDKLLMVSDNIIMENYQKIKDTKEWKKLTKEQISVMDAFYSLNTKFNAQIKVCDYENKHLNELLNVIEIRLNDD